MEFWFPKSLHQVKLSFPEQSQTTRKGTRSALRTCFSLGTFSRGMYFAFCAPKGGGKVFNSVYVREEFLVAPSNILPGISQENSSPGIFNERNEGNTKFLTKRVSKEKIPKLFPKKVSSEKMVEILKLFPN